MHSTYFQHQNSLNMLSWFCNLQALESHSLALLFSPPINQENSFNQGNQVQKDSFVSTNWKGHYESQLKRNIILNQAKQHETLKLSKISLSDQQTSRTHKKSVQKETRNINSNLLRIFFKNLIELKVYSSQIDSILTRIKPKSTKEEFYTWIQGFGINFKNYIRGGLINKIMKRNQPSHFKKVFMFLLGAYSRETGLLHCLTSKRIQRGSLKLHLQGLRALLKMLPECF